MTVSSYIWGINYSHATMTPPDPDPNVLADDPHTNNRFFNSGNSSHGLMAYIAVDGVLGESATVETYVFMKGVAGGPTTDGKWVQIQAATLVDVFDPIQVPVPPCADIHVRLTAVVGAPTGLFVGITPS